MFIGLLVATFAVSLAVCFIVVRLFRNPVESILARIVEEGLAYAWTRYLTFAILVTGLSGGVRIWDLEKYISPQPDMVLELNGARWVLEVYRTVIGTLQSIAWMLLVFFIFALIAYVITRGMEMRNNKNKNDEA